MSYVSYDYMDEYLRGLIPESEGILGALEAYAEENRVPIVTKDVAELLKTLVKLQKPRRILEIGTAIGYSAILMGLFCPEDFALVTLERSEAAAAIAVENFRRAGMEDRITVMVGEAEDSIPQLTGSFDLIFMDAAKGQYLHWFRMLAPMLRQGGLLVCDNVLFRGMVANRQLLIRRKITIVKRLKKFLRFITHCPALQSTILPLGDGVSISYKCEEVIFDE